MTTYPHGTYACYHHGPDTRHTSIFGGCRCNPCRDANNSYMSHRRRLIAYDQWQPWGGLVPTIGAQRRARALAYLGHAFITQARALTIPQQTYNAVASGAAPAWSHHRAQAQAALYDRLAWVPGPTGQYPDRCRRAAQAAGWASPAAWDDDTIDDPDATPNTGLDRDDQADPVALDHAAAGRLTWGALNRADQDALVERLIRAGWAPSRIARQYGLSGTTITDRVAHLDREAVAA